MRLAGCFNMGLLISILILFSFSGRELIYASTSDLAEPEIIELDNSQEVVWEEEYLEQEEKNSSTWDNKVEEVSPLPEEEVTATKVPELDNEKKELACKFHNYFSAYIPPLDQTEFKLGLLLGDFPGFKVSLDWTATPDIKLGVQVKTQGVVNSSYLSMHYALGSATSIKFRPALATLIEWETLNYSQENKVNILQKRGINLGLLLSQNLGDVAKALTLNDVLQQELDHFKLHLTTLIEYQKGRNGKEEKAFDQIQFRARVAGSWEFIPAKSFIYLVWDSLPIWDGAMGSFLGFKYLILSRTTVEFLLGEVDYTLTGSVSLNWIF